MIIEHSKVRRGSRNYNETGGRSQYHNIIPGSPRLVGHIM